MSTALSVLIADLQKRMDEEYELVSGTVDSGSTTTVVDATRDEGDDYWINCWIYIDDTTDDLAPMGEEHRIIDFANSTGTITISPAFTVAPDAADTYEIRRVRPRWQYVEAVNHALREAEHAFYEYTVDDTTIIICNDKLNYDLPTNIKALLRVEIERTDVDVDSTATGSTGTTLVDTTKSWDVDEWNSVAASYAVVVYDGTGQGQQRTITDTAADTLTVATWTTNPDTTSKYKIKYIGQEEQIWAPITAFDIYLTAAPVINLDTQYETGMSLRLYYAHDLVEITADASTTDVPKQYIMLEGMSYLWETAANRGTGGSAEYSLAQASNYAQRANMYKNRNGFRLAWGRISEPKDAVATLPSDYPF